MNAIIGLTGLLLPTELNPYQRDLIETVQNSGEALMIIINDILDFSKIEDGKLAFDQKLFDLSECIESSLDVIAIMAADKKLKLAYQMDPDVPATIVGDAARLRQVLVNLLGNAVKFTEEGEVALRVMKDEERTTQEGTILHFSVRDTGIGVPTDQTHRLFESFSQLDPSKHA